MKTQCFLPYRKTIILDEKMTYEKNCYKSRSNIIILVPLFVLKVVNYGSRSQTTDNRAVELEQLE